MGLDLGSLAGLAAESVVDSVTVETTATPPVTAHPLGDGPSSPLLQLLKPKFTISGVAGKHSFAPYGEPGQGGELVGVAILVGFAALVFFAAKGMKLI